MSEHREFNVGDQVVYPSHGVGKIMEQEEQYVAGSSLKVYVIAFEKDKMTLKVPVKRATKAGLRSLSTVQEVDQAVATLKSKAKLGRGMWSRRAQEYETKINSGNLLCISEVVRDLHKNVDDPDRSYSERIIYEAALNRLAGEYAAVKEVSIIESISKLEAILKRKVAKSAAAAANNNKARRDNTAEAA